ncbi:hypothetical protein [Fimbriimonas ginsengisoli]|uniref:Uncharacterized protein n=1 Tax=Fimbriimonas ginsengisoli Gsoil 348 TaxID=661478 RepID=A0A068NJH5_FIMGI|nr:hypothetical protein [Fimbriimonas ginsengisoli]AIE83587.1 hypothetical protein OP10G_0219 [Fimbriimonas ginsengisoli Gsoil 348]
MGTGASATYVVIASDCCVDGAMFTRGQKLPLAMGRVFGPRLVQMGIVRKEQREIPLPNDPSPRQSVTATDYP